MPNNRKRLFFVLVCAAALLLVLAGCRPAEQAAAPAEAYPGAPAGEEAGPVPDEESYPAPEELPAAAEIPTETYPAPVEEVEEGPAVPARPNLSRISAQLIEAAPSAEKPGYTLLKVKLLTSEAAEGMASVTDRLVGQEMDLLIETAQLPALKPGETFEAEVSFRGDEHGAAYYILKLIKIIE